MTISELELLRLQLRGIPVHKHASPKRGEWLCTSPYCLSLADETPRVSPGEHPDEAARYDLGDFNA